MKWFENLTKKLQVINLKRGVTFYKLHNTLNRELLDFNLFLISHFEIHFPNTRKRIYVETLTTVFYG